MEQNKKIKILVVDDEPRNIDLVEIILSQKDYDIVRAEDGLDALVMVKKENPDLIVLDVMMPELNGYDVCHELRFNKDFEKIPILLYTAREQEIDEKIGNRVNIDYIQKPIDNRLFLQKVENLLSAQKSS